MELIRGVQGREIADTFFLYLALNTSYFKTFTVKRNTGNAYAIFSREK